MYRILADIADPYPDPFEGVTNFFTIGIIVGLVFIVAVAAILIISKIKKGK